ncbi:hypothetical protein MG290_03060 [Flavobacterium sp. CBA20B-1]|uniref:hypothetical protein n=1 Tax=unclassified Flavobacterium TaxID=196869 RepID=UPI0022242239|nr:MULTISPECIES: hypothetical protein [unclassified Flavobacterium]WCM42672.1 hypothetical protein MG290_03060 [Flavobacterium sp. CBA20B-1]
MKKLLPILFLLLSVNFMAQNIITQEYYEGVINNDIKISMYLKTYEDGCPRTDIIAIYKYQKSEEHDWILLHPTYQKNSKQLTLVEDFNTGILLLNKEANGMNGLWISPDGKKQFKVQLNKINVNNKEIERLENILEEVFYYSYDC